MDFPAIYKRIRLKAGVVELINEPFPKNMAEQANAVIIKIVYMSLCRTDIREVQNSRTSTEDRGPLFGHEFFGQIIYAGENTDFDEGEYVTLNPNITPDRSTGFAEYFFISGDRVLLQKALIPIESELIDPLWMPEPFACIIHSLNNLLDLQSCEDFSNKSVAIIGAGNSGILYGLSVKYLLGSIKLFNRGAERLNFIKEKQLFAESEISSLSTIENDYGRYDLVIAVPTVIDNDILMKSFQLLKNNGYLHIYGGTKPGDKFLDTTIDIDTIRLKEQKVNIDYQGKMISLTGANSCSDYDFYEAIRLFDEDNDAFPLQKLVSKTVTLSEFPALITSLVANQTDQPGKIIVLPDTPPLQEEQDETNEELEQNQPVEEDYWQQDDPQTSDISVPPQPTNTSGTGY